MLVVDLSIGLMKDNVYATCSKFTAKPCLHEIFSNFWYLHIVFACVFFLSLLLWVFVHGTIYNLHVQKEVWW